MDGTVTEYHDWGNGLAEGRYARIHVGAPGTRLCVLWLAPNQFWDDALARFMMFFGLPFGVLAVGIVQFLVHPLVPFHRKVTETLLAPLKVMYFIATGKGTGLWEMDF